MDFFAPIVQYEKWKIHPVFPHFPYFRLGKNLSLNLLAPLCGVALGKIRWRKEPVKRVVKDGMLAKKRVQNDDYELYDGRHEAIITEEQWACAKAAQAKRNHPPTHKERH